ncbi:hypothetical protein CDL15_Pgr022402 [Punica granatum]|uniref:ARC105/Med15 mediator subunit C-terminal domain-containing protein n=1 Tax=Punica granatum TaxID=22663 RepID=A0A218XQ06_PUNGR|nr:hypothetical protein CDL15_Pgr022402 [Punica granatum]
MKQVIFHISFVVPLDSTAQAGQANGGDWQEEIYKKIKYLKDSYGQDLNEMYQKIATKLQQHDSLPQQPKSEQLEKLKIFKVMLERLIAMLQVPKSEIYPSLKDKLPSYERQIVQFLNSNRPRKQQGQLPPHHMHSVQPQQPQPHVGQVQSNENQMNPPMNIQGSGASMHQNSMTSMQHNSMSSFPVVSNTQPMMSSLQPNPSTESGQGNAMNSLQQVTVGSMPQNPVSAPQQHQLVTGQRPAYPHQQLKPGSSFPISSPQLLQAVSPQIPQHSSPQIDQQNLLTSITKTGTPLQSASSPFVVPSPSTPLAPSPMPADSENQKPASGISSLSNAGSLGHQHITAAPAGAQSLAIGTPGISASPLLAECSGPDGAHVVASTAVSGKSTVTEYPIERLIRAVKSASPQALGDAVNDIGSVVSMVDRIAGSAPGNGSRAAIGEDLVAMTKCRMQARNFIMQDGPSGTKKIRRYTSAMPLSVASSAGSMNDSFKQIMGAETSDLESTASSSAKRSRSEANHVLKEEIREINQRLIDTVVDISDEDVDPTAAAAVAEGGDGVVVRCSFNAVSLSPGLKSQYGSAQLSPIQPLRLLVPSNYPNCSPVLLDKFPVEVSKEYEDLSAKAKSRFSISLRRLSQPMSLKDIARTWDNCSRAVILEYAEQSGGGSFSSKYGTWENIQTAT